MKRIFIIASMLAAVVVATASAASSFQLRSPAFAVGSAIPAVYTCDGKGVSPPLAWSGVPGRARSLALIVTDPDAPGGTFVHWIVYNLPASASHLERDANPSHTVRFGRNSDGERAYYGLCPPSGTHHYHFKLYALDTRLPTRGRMTRSRLMRVMRGHQLETAELVGTYRRGR
jgi:Raf kinase inhibitor-like YbhB/YbcL family protein